MATSSLDPVLIMQLSNLELRARRVLDGFFAGHHINRNRGHAQDFSEHRPYNPGDEIKNIDWKVFGRTDRLVVKQYEEQTNVQATLLMDHSGSMAFSEEGRPSKLEYAKVLAAAIGYVVVMQNDAIGLLSQMAKLPAASQLAQLHHLFGVLESLRPSGIWNADSLARDLEKFTKKKGFVVLFSDLMADSSVIIQTLKFIQARKNEVLVFQILDPAELSLPYSGPIVFEDLENGSLIQTEPESMRQAYQAWVRQHLELQAQSFRSLGIDHAIFTTDTSFDRGLGAYLSWRSQHL